MEALAREGFEFVAVFDADFKPEPGFLHRTLPYLMGNPQVGLGGAGPRKLRPGRRGGHLGGGQAEWLGIPAVARHKLPAVAALTSPSAPPACLPARLPSRPQVGYVQSRWVFTNPQESYLTKAQEVSWRLLRPAPVCEARGPVPALALRCAPPPMQVCPFEGRRRRLPGSAPPADLLRPAPALRLPHPCLPPAPQVSLNYHMKCEQYTHSAARSFFNFNGTAGKGAGPRGVVRSGSGAASWH